MSLRSLLLIICLWALPPWTFAMMPLPADLANLPPHHPQVVAYVTTQYVSMGKMTPAEADATLAYMTFRYDRRRADLAAVAGQAPNARRAYMKARRQERGNPLVEYAAYTGIPLPRAAALMDLMHDRPKGKKYQEQLP